MKGEPISTLEGKHFVEQTQWSTKTLTSSKKNMANQKLGAPDRTVCDKHQDRFVGILGMPQNY